MRTALKLAIAVVATLALAVPATQAGAHAAGLGTSLSADPHTVEPAGQIACTVTGCQRIPTNCHPEADYNFDGIPTGFDKIVCTGGMR